MSFNIFVACFRVGEPATFPLSVVETALSDLVVGKRDDCWVLASGGEVFKTWDKLDAAGYSIADTILVRDGFSKDQPDAVTALLKVYGQALDLYRNKPDEAAEVVAKAAGVSVDVATSDLKEYDFISLKDQLSPKWLGTPGQAGKFAEVLLHTAQFLVEQKSIIKALPLEAYQKGIDVRFLQQALS